MKLVQGFRFDFLSSELNRLAVVFDDSVGAVADRDLELLG
jgi:hypothetical protein